MAGVRYRVDDLPPKGAGAFTPSGTRNPGASSWGLVHVAGSPGNLPVPSPAPSALPPISADPRTQPSNVSPDFIMPSVYVASVANMGPQDGLGLGMTRRLFHELPVPAVDYLRVPKRAMVGPNLGGRYAMAWPRAFQRFPTRRQAEQGG